MHMLQCLMSYSPLPKVKCSLEVTAHICIYNGIGGRSGGGGGVGGQREEGRKE